MRIRRFTAVLLAILVLCSSVPAVLASPADGTTTIEGTLELEVSEQVHAGGRMSATFDYSVRDEHGKRTPVTFAGEPPRGFEGGAKVRIKGHRDGNGNGVVADGQLTVLADAGGSTDDLSGASSATVQAAATIAPVAKRLAVILVNFASNPVQPYSAAYVRNSIFNNTDSVAAFYAEDSYGAMTLTGDVSGWFTISYDTGTCDTAAIQTKADAAATAAGVVLSGYTNITYIFPHLNACSFAGRAQLPGARSWINTISATSPKIHEWVISHELGHNFGVNHANSYNCTASGVRVTIARSGSDCASTEYGDPLTIMGAWNPIERYPHNIAWHRLQMGFIASSERRTVTASGLYTLGATAFAATAPKAIRINRTGSTAARHWFEIEFRQPDVLFDGFDSTEPIANGASIRLVADDDERRQSFLLDTTPTTSSFDDAPLRVGRTFTDPLSGIAVTTVGFVTDTAGNKAVKLKIVFPNTPAPAAPGSFKATSSGDGLTATLSWSPAVTPVGVASYRIYRDDALVATVAGTATSYTDPDRVPGTTYSYRIEAIDWIDLVGASAAADVLMLIPEIGTTIAWFGDQEAAATELTEDTQPPTATNATTLTFALHFSAPVTRLTKASLLLGGSATGCTVTGLTGSGADYNVTVSGCSEGTVSVSIDAGAVWDNTGYLAPAEAATSDTLLIDRTAPVGSKPGVLLREGSKLSGSAMPVRIVLGGRDESSGVASFEVARSIDGKAYATIAAATASTALYTKVAPGHTYRFRVRSRDEAGNLSAWVESVLVKPALTQDSSSSIAYRGTWSRVTATAYSGSTARKTGTVATASYTVKGRGIALVATTASTRGKVKVYIDGMYVRTVDLYSSSAAYRVLAFSQMFSSSGTHTIKVVALATPGRPRVDLDAFAVFR
ncbi:MAG TPA: hypothetical protein VFP56_06015 [Candidatus Limnocylindrales bacterium]|nr:hypothetical protein [Candidatus Limnocylindrales bacterium]